MPPPYTQSKTPLSRFWILTFVPVIFCAATGTRLSGDPFLFSFKHRLTVVGKAISWVILPDMDLEVLIFLLRIVGVWKARVIINIGWTGRGNEVAQAKLLLHKHLEHRPMGSLRSAWRKETKKTKIRRGQCCIHYVRVQSSFYVPLVNSPSYKKIIKFTHMKSKALSISLPTRYHERAQLSWNSWSDARPYYEPRRLPAVSVCGYRSLN